MVIKGYKYTNKAKAMEAAKLLIDTYLTKDSSRLTTDWVEVKSNVGEFGKFYYFEYDETIDKVLGKPTEFDIDATETK